MLRVSISEVSHWDLSLDGETSMVSFCLFDVRP